MQHLLASEVEMRGEGLGIPQGNDGTFGQAAPHANVRTNQLDDIGVWGTRSDWRSAKQPPQFSPVGSRNDNNVPATGAPKGVFVGTVNGHYRVDAAGSLRFLATATELDDKARVFERIPQAAPLVRGSRKHEYVAVERTDDDVRGGPTEVAADG